MPKYSIEWANQFKKDYKLVKKRGCDLKELEKLIEFIVNGDKLPAKYKNHPLIGEWVGCFDAHVGNDWILIYEYVDDNTVKFLRTGTHSDLFG
jgi:mRNA interferase YafQ